MNLLMTSLLGGTSSCTVRHLPGHSLMPDVKVTRNVSSDVGWREAPARLNPGVLKCDSFHHVRLCTLLAECRFFSPCFPNICFEELLT